MATFKELLPLPFLLFNRYHSSSTENNLLYSPPSSRRYSFSEAGLSSSALSTMSSSKAPPMTPSTSNRVSELPKHKLRSTLQPLKLTLRSPFPLKANFFHTLHLHLISRSLLTHCTLTSDPVTSTKRALNDEQWLYQLLTPYALFSFPSLGVISFL